MMRPDVTVRAAAVSGAEAVAALLTELGHATAAADAHAFYPKCELPYTGRRFAAPLPRRQGA
jgi:hypothetical protein